MPAAKKESESQLEKFKEAAREVETDDREETFDRALKQVAKPQSSPKTDRERK